MQRSAKVVLFLMVLGVAISLCVIPTMPRPGGHFSAGSVVKVQMQGGHGSAVHIGGGNFLTAAHVVGDQPKATLIADDGTETPAEIVWVNRAHDLALIKAESSAFAASRLSCRTPYMDELLFAKGNPVNLTHITTRGHVAGVVREMGPWRSVVPVDLTVAGGMSGGGVFDQSGNLVGITVGLMLQPLGFGGTAIPIAYIVPGSVICSVMARDA